MFKRKKKKTGTQIPPQYNPPHMPSVKPPKPPTSGSNAFKPTIYCGHQPCYTSTQNPPDVFSSIIKSSPVAVLPNDIGTMEIMCQYETPCGWCTKWDKKCDRKIGRGDDKPKPVSASTSVRSGVLDSAPVDPRSTVLQNKLD